MRCPSTRGRLDPRRVDSPFRRHAIELISHRRDEVSYLLKQRFADVDPSTRTCLASARVRSSDHEVVDRLDETELRAFSSLDRLTDRHCEVLSLPAAGAATPRLPMSSSSPRKRPQPHHRHLRVLGVAPSLDDHRRAIAVLEYVAT